MHLGRGFNLALEGVLIVGVGATIQELRSHLHDRLTLADDSAAHLDHLTRVLVDDGVDLSSGGDLIALLQRLSTRNHAELVGQVNKLKQIAINLARENGLSDSLPSHDNGKVHWSVNSLARTVHKCLACVADG